MCFQQASVTGHTKRATTDGMWEVCGETIVSNSLVAQCSPTPTCQDFVFMLKNYTLIQIKKSLKYNIGKQVLFIFDTEHQCVKVICFLKN